MEKEKISINHIGVEEWRAVKECISNTNMLELGTYYSNMINSDIKHLVFTLSRYKFVAKMLMYRKDVHLLELGCQEALGAVLFKQNIDLATYMGVDLDEEAIRWNQKHLSDELRFICSNFFDCREIETENYDVVVSLDVIEHIAADMEDEFCCLLCRCMKQDGVAIIGTPNITMSPYACEASKIGHINLYNQERLYKLMNKYFHNVFIFNMNDEVVNTGFAPMSSYIFAMCCNKK